MLLKGVNKRVIIIKNPESEIFEEAYFIVKNKSIFTQAKENEMVLEANRIISDYSRQQKISAGDSKNKGSGNGSGNKINKNDKNEADNAQSFPEDPFDENDFFEKNNFGDLNSNKFAYPAQGTGFKLVSSKKISRLKLPVFKVPPKSFFIGVGLMSALVIAARIFEFILSG